MAEPVQFTTEETVSLISNKAKETGIDSFRVRIMRRVPGRSTMDQTATLDEATAEHCSMPESWLPMLVGGGDFFLLAFHASDKLKPVGGIMQLNINGPAKEIDPTVTLASEWTGPRMIIHPKIEKSNATRPGMTYSTSVPNTDYTDPRPGFPGYPPGTMPPISSSAQPGLAARIAEENLRNQQRELDEKRRQMEANELRREYEAKLEAERKANRETEARRESEVRFEKLQRELESLKSRPAETPKPDLMTQLAPVVQELIKMQAETRKLQQDMQLAQMKMQQEMQIEQARIAAQAEKDRREAATANLAIQQKQAEIAAAQNATLLQSLLNKPPIDPAIREVLKELKENNGSQVLNQMTSGMSSMLQMMTTAMENNLFGGEDESTAVVVTKEVTKALGALAEAYVMSQGSKAPRLPSGPNAPRQLPPRRQRPQVGPDGNFVPAQELPPNARPRHAEFNGFVAGKNGTSRGGTLEHIENMFVSGAEPVAVATAFLQSLSAPDMDQALRQVGGNFQQLFASRSKIIDFVRASPDNMAYGKQVLDEIVRLATDAGLIQMEPRDDSSVDPEGSTPTAQRVDTPPTDARMNGTTRNSRAAPAEPIETGEVAQQEETHVENANIETPTATA